VKLPKFAAQQALLQGGAAPCEAIDLGALMPQASAKARLNKDYKTGRIGNRAGASVKVPSGEEEYLLDECYRKRTPPGFSTWAEYFRTYAGTELVTREYLIKLCQQLMGATMY